MINTNASNVQKEYHDFDATSAIKSLLAAFSIPKKDAAKAIKTSDTHLSHMLSFSVTHHQKSSVETVVRFEIEGAVTINTRSHFKPRDYTTLSNLICKRAGIEPFLTIPAMIHAAQALPDASTVEWIRTDYPSQEQEKHQLAELSQLKLYKRAAQLLLPALKQDHQFRMSSLPNTTHSQTLSSYLNDKFIRASDTLKLESLRSFANAAGDAFKLENELTLDGMLDLARTRFPSEFPAQEQSTQTSGRSL